MDCKFCGETFPDDSKFCPGCGTAVKEEGRSQDPRYRDTRSAQTGTMYGGPQPQQPEAQYQGYGGSYSQDMRPSVGRASGGENYVGFWPRVGAYWIDSIIIAVVSFIAGFIVGIIIQTKMGGQDDEVSKFARIMVAGLLGLVITWLYYALSESSGSQATVGKQAIGAKVVDGSGGRLSFGQASGRYFSKLISGMVFGIGYFMVAFTEKHQGLHDIIAGTYVVYRTKR